MTPFPLGSVNADGDRFGEADGLVRSGDPECHFAALCSKAACREAVAAGALQPEDGGLGKAVDRRGMLTP